MALTKCMECSRSISDSAGACPSCGTKDPFGVTCELCSCLLRRSDGVTSTRMRRSGYEYVSDSIVAHQNCIQRFFTLPSSITCTDCGLHLAGADPIYDAQALWSVSKDREFTCPRCGARDVASGDLGVSRLPPPSRPRNCGGGCDAPYYPFQGGPYGHGHGHPRVQPPQRASSSGCFVATAALDGAYSSHLEVLCAFRDRYLLSTAFGRKCVRFYYSLSPFVATKLARSRVARLLVRETIVLPAARLVRAVWFRANT